MIATKPIRKFVAREAEIAALRKWKDKQYSQLTAVYGRRRIGKTTLVEAASQGERFIKFEGLEGGGTAAQRQVFKEGLIELLSDPAFSSTDKKASVIKRLESHSWRQLLIALSELIGNEPIVVLLDEFQWLAAERTLLVSTLKEVWDNYFAKNNRVHLIVCGSISSFIVKKVIRSKALFGRIDLKIHLKALKVHEIAEGFFPQSSPQQAIEYWLALGGVPKYFELCDPHLSFQQNITKLFFSPYAPLQHEIDNLFVSHFGKQDVYEKVVSFLANRKFVYRQEIAKKVKITSGGGLSKVLEELELAGFIAACSTPPSILKEKAIFYSLSDPFLRFYLKFVKPKLNSLDTATSPLSIQESLPQQQFSVWRGHAFEGLCHYHHKEIARKLGFEAVRYHVGSVPDKRSLPQIDLAFERADGITTVCELKFQTNVGLDVVEQSRRTLEAVHSVGKKSIQYQSALVSVHPPTAGVYESGFFVRVITAEDFVE